MKRDSLFDKWFAFNYERLRAVFGRYLNEDAFHDAYLAMKKTCAFSDVAVERFEPYFFGVYKKCKSMCLRGESRYCHPDKEHFFLLRPEEETPSAEALAASDRLAYDILLFVRNKYPKRDYELFRLKEVRKAHQQHDDDSCHISTSYHLICKFLKSFKHSFLLITLIKEHLLFTLSQAIITAFPYLIQDPIYLFLRYDLFIGLTFSILFISRIIRFILGISKMRSTCPTLSAEHTFQLIKSVCRIRLIVTITNLLTPITDQEESKDHTSQMGNMSHTVIREREC